MVSQMAEMRQDIREGFRHMEEAFAWGLARVCWEHEQDRELYRQILTALQQPLETQALELRRRAERAIQNGWWEDAVEDLRAALQHNRYDYLAHLQLGRILWFEFGMWQAALDAFGLGARYADVRGGTDAERYYAALAHTHISLLWRMGADASRDRTEECPPRALQAAVRAVELCSDLAAAVIEHLTVLLLLGRDREAEASMKRLLLEKEALFWGLGQNPDTAGHGGVVAMLGDWQTRCDDCQTELGLLADDLRDVVSPRAVGAEGEREREASAAPRQALLLRLDGLVQQLRAAVSAARDAVRASEVSPVDGKLESARQGLRYYERKLAELSRFEVSPGYVNTWEMVRNMRREVKVLERRQREELGSDARRSRIERARTRQRELEAKEAGLRGRVDTIVGRLAVELDDSTG
jgi:tetratricopeptide (TPR) repeat protein